MALRLYHVQVAGGCATVMQLTEEDARTYNAKPYQPTETKKVRAVSDKRRRRVEDKQAE